MEQKKLEIKINSLKRTLRFPNLAQVIEKMLNFNPTKRATWKGKYRNKTITLIFIDLDIKLKSIKNNIKM